MDNPLKVSRLTFGGGSEDSPGSTPIHKQKGARGPNLDDDNPER